MDAGCDMNDADMNGKNGERRIKIEEYLEILSLFDMFRIRKKKINYGRCRNH